MEYIMKIIITIIAIVSMFTIATSKDTDNALNEKLDNNNRITFDNSLILNELPDDFPELTIHTSKDPAPGNLLLTVFSQDPKIPGYIMVLDSLAKPLFYRKPATVGIDLKLAPNGLFTYAEAIMPAETHQIAGRFVQNAKVIDYILDPEFNLIDSVQCKNGYLADIHEFQILPNGNFLMLAYESVPIDMSQYVYGGNPNAVVIGSVIQELDKDKNCLFQWRSLDHIPLLNTFSNTQNASFEHVHANSYHLDTDGNMLVSFTASFQIVKIDMITGDILWRFGGPGNEFKILNDDDYLPFHFSMQHDIKRLPNGNFLFFDNGFAKFTPSSRAVEFEVDEENKIATKVWEYRRNPDIAAFAMGSAQRLNNGNTLINWGIIFDGEHRTVTEVTPEGEVVYELSLPTESYSYRGLKYELPACRPVADVTVAEAWAGNTYKFRNKTSDAGIEYYITELDAFMYNYMIMKKYDCSPMYPEFEGEAPVLLNNRFHFTTRFVYSMAGELRFDISKLPPRYNYDLMRVYHRLTTGKGVFRELTTTYDMNENTLIAMISDTGEYVIGFLREAEYINPPSLMLPMNNAFVLNNEKVNLLWSPTGRYSTFDIDIADDDQFLNIVEHLPGISETNVDIQLEAEKEYFWRVKTYYKDLGSEWSQPRSFRLTGPTLAIDYPEPSIVLLKDSVAVIRWTTNLPDSLRITLYKGGEFQTVLKDSLYSHTRAFAWKISKSLANSDNYSIEIKSIKEDGLTANSEYFTIKDNSSYVEDGLSINESSFTISPNPSYGNSKLKFNAASSGEITIKLFDMLGSLTTNEFRRYINEGINNFNLDISHLQPGMYFCMVSFNGKTTVEKIVIMK